MFFSTPVNAPLPATTPIGLGSNTPASVILSLPIEATLVKGSLLEYDATLMVTDDTGRDVWVGCHIMLGASATDTGGFPLSTPCGFGSNATPDIHHKMCQESGRVVLTEQLVNPFLNFVINCAWSSAASLKILTVNAGSGRLTLKVTAPGAF